MVCKFFNCRAKTKKFSRHVFVGANAKIPAS
ncbi:DUF1661 domain-containing protein [Porphyromonas gulae]|nr:DUF1661 domain-containing protein [Porphyromonas gulae]